MLAATQGAECSISHTSQAPPTCGHWGARSIGKMYRSARKTAFSPAIFLQSKELGGAYNMCEEAGSFIASTIAIHIH